jgi:hypothetical protein
LIWGFVLVQLLEKQDDLGIYLVLLLEKQENANNSLILTSWAGSEVLDVFFLCHFLAQKVTKNFGPQSLLPIGSAGCWTSKDGRLDFWCLLQT